MEKCEACFRRHNRQLIHATRDRNYKENKKIIAKNRKKRIGQETDSLSEIVKEKGEQYLHQLNVYPGKKVIRKKNKSFNRGDVVHYHAQAHVVKGYGEMGRTFCFVGQNKYFAAKDYQLLKKNSGIICL